MPRRRRVKEGRWIANVKQGYYHICQRLGLSTRFQCNANVTEAINYAVHQNGEDIREVYEYLARRNRCTEEAAKQEIDGQIAAAYREILQCHPEDEARQLIEHYFEDKNADITKPEVFIYGMARYLRKSR